MSSQQDYLEATIVEAEVIEVEFIEDELVTVNFTTIDVIQDRGWVVNTIKACFVYSETPTQLTVRRFRVANSFVEGSLQVEFNGLKEQYITIHSSTEFSLPIDSIVDDTIEVSYIKQ